MSHMQNLLGLLQMLCRLKLRISASYGLRGRKRDKKANQKKLVFLKILVYDLKGVIPIARLINVENPGDW